MPEKRPYLSKKDKEKIRERDGYTSGMRHYSEERGFYQNKNCPYDGKPCSSLQVHHIEPVRKGLFLRKSGQEINDPDNLITVFECEHVGHCKDGRIR